MVLKLQIEKLLTKSLKTVKSNAVLLKTIDKTWNFNTPYLTYKDTTLVNTSLHTIPPEDAVIEKLIIAFTANRRQVSEKLVTSGLW